MTVGTGRTRWLVTVTMTLAAFCLVAWVGAGTAHAGPAWITSTHHSPTHFTPGDTGIIDVLPTNIGDSAADGTELLTIELPAGLTATSIDDTNSFAWWCTGTTTITCTRFFFGTDTGPPAPVRVVVSVDPAASGTANVGVALRGGGAPNTWNESEPIPIGSQPASFGVVPSSVNADAYDATGRPERQAGAHPWISKVEFDMATAKRTLGDPTAQPVGGLKTVRVVLPHGFVGNPEALPKCGPDDFVRALCAPQTQIGALDIKTNNGPETAWGHLPVYNVVPPTNIVANFGIVVSGRPVHIRATLSGDGQRLITTIPDINEAFTLQAQSLTLWGVPADPAHDGDRACSAAQIFPGVRCSVGIAQRAFLTLPSECGVPDSVNVNVRSYEDQDTWSSANSPAQVLSGCEKQQFRSSIEVFPDTTQPDAPTGLAVDLAVEQDDNPRGLGTPPLRKAVVRLPEGVSVSPSSADGLQGCSPDQIRLGTTDEPTCPEASNIGTVSVTTPLLPDPMRGTIFLASQSPTQLLRIYLVLRAPGLLIKLSGKVDPDPVTGQLTTTFDDNPPLPFSLFSLRFKGGPRGALATPQTCGVKTSTAELTPWNGAIGASNLTHDFSVTVDGSGRACDPAFSPGFSAGSVTPRGGKDTVFTLTVDRPDRNQYLSTVDVSMPTGLLGRIATATLCGDAAASAGTCGEASRIGSVTAASGPGSSPFYISGGRVYITGPYKGGPYGLSIVVPAVAGPFDLGNVIVRAAIHVDPVTAALRVTADPMPSILQGIPLRIRKINIAIDRPRFMFNPSDCSPKSIVGQIGSVAGVVVGVQTRFQVANCASLPYRPMMTLRVGRRGHTARDRTTPLTATLTQAPGEANSRVIDVNLPDTINARLPVVNRACRLAEFHAGRCGAGARIGSAEAVTPLLRQPLRGSAYFVRNPARRLPDIMIPLRGEVAIDLTGLVSIPGGRTLRTRFETIPDAPITRFTLRLVDGRNGPVGAVGNLCSRRTRRASLASLQFRAHSNRLIERRQRLIISGCGRKAAGRRAARRNSRDGRKTPSRPTKGRGTKRR